MYLKVLIDTYFDQNKNTKSWLVPKLHQGGGVNNFHFTMGPSDIEAEGIKEG